MTAAFLPAFVVLWAIVLFQALIILGLVRTVRELQTVVESGRLPRRLPVGTVSPDFRGSDLRTGAEIDSSELIGRELVILFLSDGCPTCRRLADGTRHVPVEPGQARIAVCHGGAREASTFVDLLASDISVLADSDGAVFSAFAITGTPAVVVVDETGTVARSGGPRHSIELAALLSTARDQPVPVVTR